MEEVFSLRLGNTAATATSHAIMSACVEEVVVIEVSETVAFRFLVLEVNEG